MYTIEQTEFRIRWAAEEDVPVILRFIRELAEYENELEHVTATEELLRQSLFDQKAAEVVLGEYEGKTVGFALFHENFSTFLGKPGLHLVDLYITPPMRGKGFGKKLLGFLAQLVQERGYGRLEWWCHEWNESAKRAYKKWGADPLDEIQVFRLMGKELK